MSPLAGRRLVVVSNRVGPVRDTKQAGGLAVALIDTLRQTGGLWLGWSGRVADEPSREPEMEVSGRVSIARVDLDPEEYERYYNGFSNGVLWPLFHYRLDLTRFRRLGYAGYCAVNRRLAAATEKLLEPSDALWVHDFHLLPLGEELRRLGCQAPIGFFLHIPFPAPEILTTLPPHEELVRAMFAYDLIGFQSEADRRCFLNYVLTEAHGRVAGDGRVSAYGRSVFAEVFPIGIDAEAFRGFATSPEALRHAARMSTVLDDRLAVIGVDRLDYTKGLPERFRSFERFLDDHPEQRGRVSFIQIAPPSRSKMQSYVDIREQLEGISGHINGEYAEVDWTPLRYINRAYSRRALAGIHRLARVALVTPLRDGMNLVAKEFVAAQAEDDPGVLVLSRFAGAAHAADGALIVNPYDIQGVADTLQRALEMERGERIERWNSLFNEVSRNDVAGWSRGFLQRLLAVSGSG